jgi:DNA-binding NtrC family response regulator
MNDMTALAQQLVARELGPDQDLVTSDSPAMQRVLQLSRGVSPTPASVLITGESGTGKEVLARLIHSRSTRASMSYVAVNCGAVVSSLAESELFGHEKGAFSGAIERRIGRFEAANKGTILLDEISEMPYALQTKLLRVLQEREIYRVGSTNPISVDVRVIATSNRDLKEMVAQGTFREDLYYRLNVFPIHVPPLRERLEDVPELAEVILNRLCYRFGRPMVRVSSRARQLLTHFPYPGNVRELHNVLERALILSNGSEIDSTDILFDDDTSSFESAPSTGGRESNGRYSFAEGVTLAEIEQQVILSALDEYDGNRTHASQTLGISVRTLRNRLREYRQQGISIPEPGFARRVQGL